ncbi:MAG TPA: hypothetical protein VHO92_05255 [Methanobacterium sp.]|nr:hypothetical protein [Methanobacterium sp.]
MVKTWHRGRISDPTGSFTIYAGQYHPEAAQFLSNCELPVFVAVVGKTSTYTTDDGNGFRCKKYLPGIY